MENENQLQLENQLTTAAVGFLKESAKWSKLMAIVGFVGIGFMVLAGLFMLIGLSALDTMSQASRMPFPMSFLAIFYILFAGIYFFPVYYLYQYATKTTVALQSKNSQLLTEGLENLKSHHKFLGIFTLVIISIYALILIFALFAGALFAAN